MADDWTFWIAFSWIVWIALFERLSTGIKNEIISEKRYHVTIRAPAAISGLVDKFRRVLCYRHFVTISGRVPLVAPNNSQSRARWLMTEVQCTLSDSNVCVATSASSRSWWRRRWTNALALFAFCPWYESKESCIQKPERGKNCLVNCAA